MLFPGEKRHINVNFLLWLTSKLAWDKRLVVPGLTRPKKFMCSPWNTGNINFSLWLIGGCPRLVPTLKKFMCSKFICLFYCPIFCGKKGKQKVYVFKVYVPFSCSIFCEKKRKQCPENPPGKSPAKSSKNYNISFSCPIIISLISGYEWSLLYLLLELDAGLHSAPLRCMRPFFLRRALSDRLQSRSRMKLRDRGPPKGVGHGGGRWKLNQFFPGFLKTRKKNW